MFYSLGLRFTRLVDGEIAIPASGFGFVNEDGITHSEGRICRLPAFQDTRDDNILVRIESCTIPAENNVTSSSREAVLGKCSRNGNSGTLDAQTCRNALLVASPCKTSPTKVTVVASGESKKKPSPTGRFTSGCQPERTPGMTTN